MLGGSVRIAVAVSLLRICSGDSPVEVATSLKTVDATLDHIHESVVLARGRHGLHATPKGDSWVGQLLRAVGEWEQPIIDIVYEGLAFKGDTIWECGGHIGAHTLGLIRIVGEGGHVHVWEPQHKTRSLLTTALTINGLLSRATVHPEALGGPDDAMQTPRLNLERVCAPPENCGNSGSFSFVEIDGANKGASFSGQEALPFEGMFPRTVPLKTLDELRAAGDISGGCPALIKSDVEGMDLRMLAGAAQIIDACQPHLLFELMQPRKTWKDVEAGLLKRHPNYICAWLVFRIIPSKDRAFRIPDSGELGAFALGPLSINVVCSPNASPVTLLPDASRRKIVHAIIDGASDALYRAGDAGGIDSGIYTATDCAEYEKALRDLGWYEMTIGSEEGSICPR